LIAVRAARRCFISRNNPSLNGGRMNAFDAGDRLRAQSFKALPGGALKLLFRLFKVIEGRSKAVAECFLALTAANDKDVLAAPKSVAAVIG
jgi:hypothetical protein